MSQLNANAAPRVIRVAPSAPTATAITPREPAQAQGRSTPKPVKFADVSSYKSHVLGSEAVKLPAARATAAGAESKLTEAKAQLAARMASLGHDALQNKLIAAEKALDDANHPLRSQGVAKRSEAAQVAQQVAGVSSEIERARQQINGAQANKSARDRDFWWGDNSKDTWVDAVADGLGALGDAGTISSGNKRIAALTTRKVELEQKALSLIMEATALEHTPGEPSIVAAAKQARDEAKVGLESAEVGESSERQGVSAAESLAGVARAELARLENVKKDLTDYGSHFGFFTRLQMKFGNWNWKKDLDTFWKSNGL